MVKNTKVKKQKSNMVGDPIGDLFARIKNAALRRTRKVNVPYSRFRLEVAKVLASEGYLAEAKKQDNDIVLVLAFKRRRPLVTDMRTISKPGLRIYRGATRLPRPLGGAGICLVSTSAGVMTGKDARKRGLGGEVLAEIW